jgi:hypothetical protein
VLSCSLPTKSSQSPFKQNHTEWNTLWVWCQLSISYSYSATWIASGNSNDQSVANLKRWNMTHSKTMLQSNPRDGKRICRFWGWSNRLQIRLLVRVIRSLSWRHWSGLPRVRDIARNFGTPDDFLSRYNVNNNHQTTTWNWAYYQRARKWNKCVLKITWPVRWNITSEVVKKSVGGTTSTAE